MSTELTVRFHRAAGRLNSHVSGVARIQPQVLSLPMEAFSNFMTYFQLWPGLTFQTAPLELLYHTRPGRGRVAPMEAILIIDPPRPAWTMCGSMAEVPK